MVSIDADHWWQRGPDVAWSDDPPRFVATSPPGCPILFATVADTEARAAIDWWEALGTAAYQWSISGDDDGP